MTKAERKILEDALNEIKNKELECFRKIAFLNEHKFELERVGVQTIFKELFEDFVGNFSDLKVRLDEAKRDEEESKKLLRKKRNRELLRLNVFK